MASDEPKSTAGGVGEADLAKAFQELAKGERTASALEAQLSAMESKIDALLEQAEREQQSIEGSKDATQQASNPSEPKDGSRGNGTD